MSQATGNRAESSAYNRERLAAIDAVRRACRVTREVSRSMTGAGVVEKSDTSPVTVADFASQAVVAFSLTEAFPGDSIVSEECADVLRTDEGAAVREAVVKAVHNEYPGREDDEILDAIDRGDHAGGGSGRFWVLDPIDGTKGFLRGEQYAVALGLVEEGRVVLGVLGCPNLPLDPDDNASSRGCLLEAVTGQGAFIRGLANHDEPRRVSASAISDPSEARVTESVESGHSRHDQAAHIAERLGIAKPSVRMDSQCKYAAVARGEADIYLRLPTCKDYREKIWDHAAGWIVVTEAGGRVSDVDGAPLDFTHGRTLAKNRGVVATAAGVHDRVIGVAGEVLEG
jgi:3'(2'), 5'-bisphosphate nucleotidase